MARTSGKKVAAASVKRLLGIRRFRRERSQQAGWTVDSVLRHPLLLVIVGFLLTALVGGWLTTRREAHEKTMEQQERSLNEAITVVRNLAAYHAAYEVRGDLLLRAMKRGASRNELITLKRDFDESYVNLKVSDFTTGQKIANIYPSSGEDAIVSEYGELGQMIEHTTACIDAAYETGKTFDADQPSTLYACRFPGTSFPSSLQVAMNEISNCSSLLLFSLGEALDRFPVSPWQRATEANTVFRTAPFGCSTKLIVHRFPMPK
jgi:type II secretory pathway pseudopilin PulG